LDYDLIVRDGIVVTPEGTGVTDIGVHAGVITEIAPNLAGASEHELIVDGLYVLPGGIDAHVHANEPGRTAWEGFLTASTALAVGGMSSYFDMPLNARPATTTGEAFDLKLRSALQHSRLDFALWGGLVPGNLDDLPELHQRGVIGFKAFMCETGLPEFRPVDDLTLWQGMKRCAELGAIVAVHAENESITAGLAERARADGRLSAQDYLETRPAIAETEAIARAIELAADTGCALHVVHVSTARGLDLVREAQRRGIDVSAETSNHYLVLLDDDMPRLGAVAKCSPPMRDSANRDRLWEFVATDPRAIVTSDHSPCSWAEKEGDDFFAIWGGMSGCQSTLPTLLNGYAEGKLALGAASAAISCNVADRFALPNKGTISVGRDADLAVVDLAEGWALTVDELRYRHGHSALVGHPMRGRVRWLISRGRTIVAKGSVVESSRGQLLRPRTSARADSRAAPQ
jgi:allantoinase